MLRTGYSEVEITPAPGSVMGCFPSGPNREPRRATGAHDPLMARAVSFSDGDETLCICSCDLAAIRSVDVEKIRARVQASIPGIAGERIAVAATHTHSSPETIYLFGNTPADPYIEEMNTKIAGAIAEAYNSMKASMLSTGSDSLDLAFNRRLLEPDGKSRMILELDDNMSPGVFDPELSIVRADVPEGGPACILFNYTAHALTVGPGMFEYSADYPGLACARVSEALGCPALFLNGAAGNVHPRRCMRQDYDTLGEVGGILGDTVKDLADKTSSMQSTRLNVASERLQFVNRADSKLTETVELSCFRLGDVIIGFVPGELFVEFQLEFKRALSPFKGFLAAYSNGWHGYIPTRASYGEGGYGVDLAVADIPEYSRTALPEGAGETITAKLIELAGSLI